MSTKQPTIPPLSPLPARAANASSVSRPRRSLLSEEPLLLLAFVLAGAYLARDVLIPLAIALTLNFLLAPMVIKLQRLKVPRLPAVLLVAAMAFVVVSGVGWIVARQVIAVVNQLPDYRENIHAKLAALNAPGTGGLATTLKSIRELGAEISSDTQAASAPQPEQLRTWRERERARLAAEKQPIPVKVVPPAQSTRQYFTKYAWPVLKPLGGLVLILVFTLYMLLKREDLRNRLLLLAGIGQLNLMTQALNEAAGRISRYLLLNVAMNAGYGLIFGVGLYLLHVPNATLWGTLMGTLRMVPYAGTMIAGLAPVAFTLAVFNGWRHPLWVLLLFLGLEFVIANFVEPHIYGKRTGISSFALVIMAVVWTLLWGWPGLIVSTPLTVCLIVMGRHVPQMQFLHILLGEEAELSPEAHFYERLLAMDQPEARQIAEKFLEGRSLLELYDDVVMPAMMLSEQDRHKGVLDDVHGIWLYQSSIELIAELSDFESSQSEKSSEDEPLPARIRPVVCIPADDHADEIAATMLAQVLEQSGNRTMLLNPSALAPEILARLAEDSGTIICISAVPPFAFAQARRLAQMLREHLPENALVIGMWGGGDDAQRLRARFGSTRPDSVVTTLAAALAKVRELEGTPDETPGEVPAVQAIP
jgi:predicted PurR-regulated permease PerM